MTLPTNYADGNTVHASALNTWDTAINANTNYLNGTTSGAVLTNPTITGYTETYYSIGTVTTTNTISLSNGTVQSCTLTASDTCVFTMPSKTAGQSFVIIVTTPASGSGWGYTFTGVLWPSATAPTATSTAARQDILTFMTDGTNWYGTFQQNFH